MKTSQLKHILAFAIVAFFTFTSCKKDTPAPQDPIVGSWVGMYGSGGEDANTFYAFNIRANGVLEIKGQDNKVLGSGTWKLESGTFTGIYTYDNFGDVYNLAAKYDEAAGELNGSWGSGKVSPDDGDFFLKKQ